MTDLTVVIPTALASNLKDDVVRRASSHDNVSTATLSRYFQTDRHRVYQISTSSALQMKRLTAQTFGHDSELIQVIANVDANPRSESQRAATPPSGFESGAEILWATDSSNILTSPIAKSTICLLKVAPKRSRPFTQIA